MSSGNRVQHPYNSENIVVGRRCPTGALAPTYRLELSRPPMLVAAVADLTVIPEMK